MAESGDRTGVAVSFDAMTRKLLPAEASPWFFAQGVYAQVDGAFAGGLLMPDRNGECEDPGSLQIGPRTSNSFEVQIEYDLRRDGGNPNDLCWQPLEISLNEDGILDVKYKGNPVLEDCRISPYYPGPGQVVIAGRTGFHHETMHVDNLVLRTCLAEDPYLQDFSNTANFFEFNLRDLDESRILEDTLALTLDGHAVLPDRVGKEGTITTASYSQAEFWPPGFRHVIRVAADLNDGPFEEREFLTRAVQPRDGVWLGNDTGLRERHLAGLLEDSEGNAYENMIDYEGSDFSPGANGCVKVDGFVNFGSDSMGNPRAAGIFRSDEPGNGSVADVEDRSIPACRGNVVSAPTATSLPRSSA